MDFLTKNYANATVDGKSVPWKDVDPMSTVWIDPDPKDTKLAPADLYDYLNSQIKADRGTENSPIILPTVNNYSYYKPHSAEQFRNSDYYTPTWMTNLQMLGDPNGVGAIPALGKGVGKAVGTGLEWFGNVTNPVNLGHFVKEVGISPARWAGDLYNGYFNFSDSVWKPFKQDVSELFTGVTDPVVRKYADAWNTFITPDQAAGRNLRLWAYNPFYATKDLIDGKGFTLMDRNNATMNSVFNGGVEGVLPKELAEKYPNASAFVNGVTDIGAMIFGGKALGKGRTGSKAVAFVGTPKQDFSLSYMPGYYFNHSGTKYVPKMFRAPVLTDQQVDEVVEAAMKPYNMLLREKRWGNSSGIKPGSVKQLKNKDYIQ